MKHVSRKQEHRHTAKREHSKKHHFPIITDVFAGAALVISIALGLYSHRDAQEAIHIAKLSEASRAPALDLRNCAYGFKNPPPQTLIVKGMRGHDASRSDAILSTFQGRNVHQYSLCDLVNHGEVAATNVSYTISYFFTQWDRDPLMPPGLGNVQTATYRISAIEPHAVVHVMIYSGDPYYGMESHFPGRISYSTQADSAMIQDHEMAIKSNIIATTLCPQGEQTFNFRSCGPIDPRMWIDVKHHVFHRL